MDGTTRVTGAECETETNTSQVGARSNLSKMSAGVNSSPDEGENRFRGGEAIRTPLRARATTVFGDRFLRRMRYAWERMSEKRANGNPSGTNAPGRVASALDGSEEA